MNKQELTPKKIVEELNKYIVGQSEAKRAVAVAIRNRYRREKLDPDLKDEVIPKNILMIGPTGVGKTEIARRLAKLVDAPFLKVEATKYTEVGYVGRDVESMIRDLIEIAIRMNQSARMKEVEEKAQTLAVERIALLLHPKSKKETTPIINPFLTFLGGTQQVSQENEKEPHDPAYEQQKEILKKQISTGELDQQQIEIEVEDAMSNIIEVFSPAGMEEMGINFQDLLGGMLPKKKRKRKLTIAEAKRILAVEEAQKLIDNDEVRREAVAKAEQNGIVFIDELDKIAGRERGHGPDVSREGVQRDILPIVEGTTVMTKYGPVKTDHILFIAAGAFHTSKPSDLIPELQGRFPIRVELQSLTEEDFKRILTEPRSSLIRQYTALLATEGIEVEFESDSISEISRLSALVNQQTENIGARRLHTIMEKLLEDLSFDAPEKRGLKIHIDSGYVKEKLEKVVKDQELSRYIL
jgi:ATP-dependent HslUV protease ATP-binding subunit HslU